MHTSVIHGNEVTEEYHVHGMTEEDMNVVADHFADCAEILKGAGYDMVLLHGGHGWLLDQFISPLYNTRTDEYGGSIENRAKFPLMVIDRIRQRCGEDFLIEYRMSGCEEIEGGLSQEEGIAFAKLLDGKVDLIHVSAGLDTEEAQAVHTHPTMFLPHGVNVHYAARHQGRRCQDPGGHPGRHQHPGAGGADPLRGARADVIAMARQSIADPYFPDKARHGRSQDIVPCLRCLDCLTGLHAGNQLSCAVNPRTAQECRFDRMSAPAKVQRRVLVVGGGPGGMQAAATAAQRGHIVTLAEQTDQLGRPAEVHRLRRAEGGPDAAEELPDPPGGEERRGREAQHHRHPPSSSGPAAMTRSSWRWAPPPPGPRSRAWTTPAWSTPPRCTPSWPISAKKWPCWAAAWWAARTGLYLAEHGHEVTIIEMQDEIAPEANWMHKEGHDAVLRPGTPSPAAPACG